MQEFLLNSMFVGWAAGVAARFALLRVDYRQYPSMPHNYVTHLAFGIIAAGVGAVAIPALVEKEFTAVTFLVLAATQFREVREMERKTLNELEDQLLVPRGSHYIEGIAAVFEARNYLVMAAALVSSTLTLLTRSFLAGGAAGALALAAAWLLREGDNVGQAAIIRQGQVRFDGPSIYVENIFIKNLGTEEEREAVEKFGLGIILEPRDHLFRDKLAQPGQRQAILHDVTAALGTRQEIAEPELAALARKDQETGTLALFVAPFETDEDMIKAVVARVPLLESARGSRSIPGGSRP